LIFNTGLNRETVKEISQDPVFKNVFGGITTMATEENGNLVFTADFWSEAIVPMQQEAPDRNLLLVSPEGNVEELNLRETYYSCLRPCKLIIGCFDCCENADENDLGCRAKQLESSQDESRYLSPSKLKETWRSRKTSIAGFTFVSPRLTSETAFSKTFREPDEHDFSEVERRSEVARSGLKERARISKFIKTECARCFVVEACHEISNARHEAAWCRAPYAMADYEAEEKVIEAVSTPYTREEIGYLLENSGFLHYKRYFRCEQYASFGMSLRYVKPELVFGLRRKSNPRDFQELGSFEEAKKVLDENRRTRVPPGPITQTHLATLIELVARNESPVSVSRGGLCWHRTVYPLLYVDRLGISQIQGNFRYNRRNKELPWRISLEDLQDFYGHYGRHNAFTYLKPEKIRH
jgi:hypothetical protein